MAFHGHLFAPSLVFAAFLVTAPAAAFDLPCNAEDSLSEAAADLLLSGAALKAEQLLPKAKTFGFDGVAVQAHESLDDAALIAWLKQQAERADAPLACGEARSESRRLVLVSARGGRLALTRGLVTGKLAPGFRAPHLVLEGNDGNTRRMELGLEQLARGVALPKEESFTRIQLVAEGPAGPRPIAELWLNAELARQQSQADVVPTPEPAPRERSRESLYGRLSAFRRREGAGALRTNQLLSASAQRHAVRVCELGKVAHRLTAGEDPETRLREEHIEARSVGEAIARAGSADAALSAVLDSPSHRMAVGERGFTDVGIGQASDAKGHTCLVVLLAAWPRRMP
jgi:uncharacterized protein YkwD